MAAARGMWKVACAGTACAVDVCVIMTTELEGRARRLCGFFLNCTTDGFSYDPLKLANELISLIAIGSMIGRWSAAGGWTGTPVHMYAQRGACARRIRPRRPRAKIVQFKWKPRVTTALRRWPQLPGFRCPLWRARLIPRAAYIRGRVPYLIWPHIGSNPDRVALTITQLGRRKMRRMEHVHIQSRGRAAGDCSGSVSSGLTYELVTYKFQCHSTVP